MSALARRVGCAKSVSAFENERAFDAVSLLTMFLKKPWASIAAGVIMIGKVR